MLFGFVLRFLVELQRASLQLLLLVLVLLALLLLVSLGRILHCGKVGADGRECSEVGKRQASYLRQ